MFVWYFNDFNERPQCARILNDCPLKIKIWEDKYHRWKSGKGECLYIYWIKCFLICDKRMLPHRQLFVCLLPYNRSRFNKALKFVIDSWTSARLKWNINWEALDCNLMISKGNIVKLMKNLFCQNIKGICHICILIPFLDMTVLHSKYVAFRPNWNKSVCHEPTKLYCKTLWRKMPNKTSLAFKVSKENTKLDSKLKYRRKCGFTNGL